MPSKFTACVLLFTFTLYCLTGCSGKETIHPADKQISFSDHKQFPVNKDLLYSSCIRLLQERGYIIRLNDPETGLINAEFSSSGLIKEDAQELNKQDNTCVNILSFVLLVGFVFLIISSFGPGTDNSDGCDYSYEDQSFAAETPVSSYKYDLMLMISSVNTDTAACRITLIRSYIENGTAVSQTALMNKYYNYYFFNDVRKNLAF